MALKVTIFEDDKDLADVLKEHMDETGFVVTNCYSLSSRDWDDADIVIADFRNKIVPFDQVREECERRGIPLLAISGAETGFAPERLKPFTLDELQASILDALKAVPVRRPRPTLVGRLLRAIGS